MKNKTWRYLINTHSSTNMKIDYQWNQCDVEEKLFSQKEIGVNTVN
jgi:hypothetical protein